MTASGTNSSDRNVKLILLIGLFLLCSPQTRLAVCGSGMNCQGFWRVDIACRRRILTQALQRLERAVTRMQSAERKALE